MKRLLLAISLAITLLIFPLKNVQAYWNTLSVNESESSLQITIGEWIIFPTWESNPSEPYEEGDIVFWEGNYYIRNSKGGNSNIEPGSPAGWNFWEQTN